MEPKKCPKCSHTYCCKCGVVSSIVAPVNITCCNCGYFVSGESSSLPFDASGITWDTIPFDPDTIRYALLNYDSDFHCDVVDVSFPINQIPYTSPPESMSMCETQTVPISDLEKANEFIQKLTELEQAFLYRALYLNSMRIDKAENIIYHAKYKKE